MRGSERGECVRVYPSGFAALTLWPVAREAGLRECGQGDVDIPLPAWTLRPPPFLMHTAPHHPKEIDSIKRDDDNAAVAVVASAAGAGMAVPFTILHHKPASVIGRVFFFFSPLLDPLWRIV